MMKKLIALVVCLVTAVAFADHTEDAAIIEAVDRAYVHGVHIDADAEKMRSGMHETFVMYVLGEKGVTQVTRDAWIARLATATGRPDTKANIKVLDRTGNTAVVKVDLFRDGKQIFTDYISMYRTSDGWKLVAKTFHRH